MSYYLTLEQQQYMDARCDVWEKTRIPDTDGKRTPGNETWVLVAQNVPYYHQQTNNVYQNTPAGEAIAPNIFSADHAFFPQGVELTGSGANRVRAQVLHALTDPYTGYYDVLGPARQNPTVGLFETNEQEVMVRVMEFTPDIPAAPLTAGTLTARPLSTITSSGASASVVAATGGTTPYLYLFQYAPHGTSTWTAIGSASSSASASVSGLATGTQYDFRALITDANGAGGQVLSNLGTITTLQEGVLSIASYTDTTVSLSWTAGSGGSGALSYLPQYRQQGTTLWIPGSSTSGLSQTISGLAQGTTYEFRVVVSDALNNQRATNTVTQTTDLTIRIVVNAINALSGTTAGGTVRLTYWYGRYQTITANVASPTGYYCSFWDDVNSPGTGKHLRPDPAVNSGLGAPCLADGTLMGKGLMLPAAVLVAAGFYGGDDTTPPTAVENVFPNSFLTDHSKGWSIADVGRYRLHSPPWYLGTNGGANTLSAPNDPTNNFDALADPNSGFNYPVTQNGAPSDVIVTNVHAVHTQLIGTGATGGNFIMQVLGRDLPWDAGSVGGDFQDQTRDLRILPDYGPWTTDGTSGNLHRYGLVLMSGRFNQAQRIIFHDFVDAQSFGAPVYRDTRDLFLIHGDSFQSPMSGATIQAIRQGANGRPAIPNACIVNLARSGNTEATYQLPLFQFVKDLDFQYRGKLGVHTLELINGANVSWVTGFSDSVKTALGSKCKIGWSDLIYNTNVNQPNYAASYAALQAGIPAHADFLVNFLTGSLPYSTFNFGDGTTSPSTGQAPEWWTGQHPTALLQEYWQAFWYALIMLCLGHGASLTTQSMRVDVTDHLNLSSGSPTATLTPTCRRYDGVDVSSGKTFTWSSSNTGVCTVNSSGVVTRVAAGRAYVKVVSSDGAEGASVVICS